MTPGNSNPFAEHPMTGDEYAAHLLAQAVYVGIRDPERGGPRGQMITWVDGWYPQAKRHVENLRAGGNRGVLEFDRERAEGIYG